METAHTAWAMIVLSLISLPLAFALSADAPIIFFTISVIWLLSPAFLSGNRALFSLSLAHSLFFVSLYARVLVGNAMALVDPSGFASYHLEQGAALCVLILLSRRFYSFPALGISKFGIFRALVIGLAVGLPYGVLDHVSGEGMIPMPEMGLVASLAWIASLSLLVGILEELLFRGILYRSAHNLVGARGASLFQGLLFSMVHYPNPVSALAAALLFAVLMVYLVQRTGSLFTPVFAHFGNNTVWMMLGRFWPITF
jgi:membrane protease YdiL (CAAX protease family)